MYTCMCSAHGVRERLQTDFVTLNGLVPLRIYYSPLLLSGPMFFKLAEI